VFVNSKSTAEIVNSKIYNSGSGSAALVGAEDSVINVSDSDINTEGKGSYVIKTGGEAKIKDGQIYISDANGIAAEDSGNIEINNCNITASGLSNGIFVSKQGSNEKDNAEAAITVKNSNISGDRRTTLFYSDKNDLRATLKGCTLDKIGYLVNSRASAVQTENTIEITLDAQEVEADVIAEEYTRVIINLKNGSLLKGSINEQNTAKYVEVNVEGGSQIELTSDSYIDVFKYNDVIDVYENGYTIYYDKENSKNDWLFSDDYQLANGGKLSPE
ncbi:MAG: right-handed parallel beta-helix repeat-containing protein, partial [Firmicutes bacterium]|nr:right-handed parallel beta-helix repeat-containing protein [Bacillota bacterium]